MDPKQLRLARAKLIEDARALATKEGATAEDIAKAASMMDESDAMKARIDTLERSASLQAELGREIQARVSDSGPTARVADARTVSRIRAAILAGRGPSLPDADKEIVADSIARDFRIVRAMSFEGGVNGLSPEDREHFVANFRNAASTGSSGAGGYTIAPLFEAELLVALKAFGGMRQVARTIQTDTGASLPWPTMDDTANQATIIGSENTQLNADTDLVFGQKTLGAFTYASGPLPVSLQLLQDSAFDFGALIEAAIVNRFGRKQNSDFTVGGGTALPWGVVERAASGTVGATGQTLKVTWPDLVSLEHSVDPAYRAGARFMFHDTVLQALKLIVDGQERPLFLPGITSGAPDTIIGYPFTINQQMPVMAANAKSILFGNFSNYIIRDVLGMQMMVLRERFADSLQVAWLAYMRSSGDLVSAGSPIKYYANSAT